MTALGTMEEWTQCALHELVKSFGRDEWRTAELTKHLVALKQLRDFTIWAEKNAPPELRRVPIE